MADDWKDNRIVVVLLALAVVGIWGTVAYRFVSGVTSSDDAGTTAPSVQTPERNPIRRADAQPYRGNFRDPFDTALGSDPEPASNPDPEPEPEPEPEPDPEPRPPRPIGLQLAGIVDETALLRGDGGAIFIVRDGERIDSIDVRSVTDTSVILSTQTRTDTLRMQ